MSCHYQEMDVKTYRTKVDRWIYIVISGTALCCLLVPIAMGDTILGIILGFVFSIAEIICCTGIRYEIRGDQLRIRNMYRWHGYPISKITEAKKSRGILSAAALSFDRVSIKFSDRSILKSSIPLEISPEDRDGFIRHLTEINPAIRT